MAKEYNQEEIDKYVRREMDEEERSAFAQKMKGDDQLAEEIQFQEDLSKTVLFKNLLDDALGDFEEKGLHKELSKEEKKPRVIPFRRLLARAATIALLIVAGSLIWANMNYSNRAFARLDYEKLQAEAGSRSGDASLQTAFDQATEALRQKEYAQAEKILNTIPEQDNNYYLSRLYLAYAQYELGDRREAVQNADLLLQNQNLEPRYKDRAQWLKLKALLTDGNKAEAQILLDEIEKEPSHVFHNEAIRLQKSLNSFWNRLVF